MEVRVGRINTKTDLTGTVVPQYKLRGTLAMALTFRMHQWFGPPFITTGLLAS